MPRIYGNVAGIIHRTEQPLAAKSAGPMKRCFKCRRLLPYDAFSVHKDGKRAVKCDRCTGKG